MIDYDVLRNVEIPEQVDHPDHYQRGDMEAIDVIEAFTDHPDDFLKGNVLKYLLRAGHKNDELQDLQKAHWYLTRLIETKTP